MAQSDFEKLAHVHHHRLQHGRRVLNEAALELDALQRRRQTAARHLASCSDLMDEAETLLAGLRVSNAEQRKVLDEAAKSLSAPKRPLPQSSVHSFERLEILDEAADVDERFLVKTRLMQGRYDASTLSLTIAPTMACNFRCVYCFEQGHYGNHLMDETTQEHLMAFIKRHAKGIQSLFITWFGGEPLVGMSVIEKLSEQIIAFCDENKINCALGPRNREVILLNWYSVVNDWRINDSIRLFQRL